MWLGIALAIAPAISCQVDARAEMRLDERHFDQDMEGGWRALDSRGCKREAADLIRSYRLAKPRADDRMLLWHEGQLRAGLGQTREAIKLFSRARMPVSKDDDGWNLYVRGTIAFLQKDRRTLLLARGALAALPRPRTPETMTINGEVVAIPWPPNLNVLDGFLKCFGQPYDVAYRCAKPLFKLEVPDKGVARR
jgi:hypothetical protein